MINSGVGDVCFNNFLLQCGETAVNIPRVISGCLFNIWLHFACTPRRVSLVRSGPLLGAMGPAWSRLQSARWKLGPRGNSPPADVFALGPSIAKSTECVWGYLLLALNAGECT